MNATQDMREKKLADSHEPRSFLRGDVGEAGIYGRDDGVRLAQRTMLSIHQLRNGSYTLNRGWVEGVEIEGTGTVDNPASGFIFLGITVAYEHKSLKGGTDEAPTYTHYKTGRYEIRGADCTVANEGTSLPPDNIQPPPSTSPANGFYSETRYRILHFFDAAGIPTNPIGPGWLQVGQDLSTL